MGLWFAEQNIEHIQTCIFTNYGTPLRRTKRRKSQTMHFQRFWDSSSQINTSYISTRPLSGILGLLCAEQNVGNLNNKLIHVHKFGDSDSQNKTSKIQKCTFRNYGTLVRRTTHRKSKENTLSDILGLWLAEQNVGNPEK